MSAPSAQIADNQGERPGAGRIGGIDTLPDGHIVRTTAEVRWLRDPRDENPDVHPGMGLRFRELLPEDARAIQAFVLQRAPLFYDE